MTAPCTWTAPCHIPGCASCDRRRAFQAAKLERIGADRKAVPLSVLRGILPPPIEPAELADAGPFLITQAYIRPSLDLYLTRHGEQVVFQVEPLHGELAGLPFCLYLAALDFRVQVVDLVRRTGGPVGPCVLLRRYLEPTAGVWSLCALSLDGVVWDPYELAPEDPPGPGADPVPVL